VKDGDILVFKSQETFAVCRKVNILKQGTISEQWRLLHHNLLIREYRIPANALAIYNNISLNGCIKTLKTLQHVSIHFSDHLQGARTVPFKVTD
jgi:hypothetical protein